jgi:hypothetical protein
LLNPLVFLVFNLNPLITIINAWLLVLKVEDSGELGDAELCRKLRVVRLDKLDAYRVSVIVNLLQLLDGLVTGRTVRTICNNNNIKFRYGP